MRHITTVVIEPVGCLAEFPPMEFEEIAARLFHQESGMGSGSEAYWALLNLMQSSEGAMSPADQQTAERLEIEAVDQVELYEDVAPALAQLRTMGITPVMASSLSGAAVGRFLERFALTDLFAGVWTRDTAGGVKAAPLARAIQAQDVPADQVMYLVDTTDGMEVAKEVGSHSILMINDYEEGRRLAMHSPTGGIVSLHELPDAIRLVTERARHQPKG
jgi:phosphoglycolate phosphatase-like HAD superfamily hydrolase